MAIAVTTNTLWSAAAWIMQRSFFGRAPKRYYLRSWKSWLAPFCIALLIGAGLSVIHALFPIIGERFRMIQSRDLEETRVLLWDLFRYLPWYLPYSALVGIWWAGEERRFSPAHIISFLGAILFFGCCLILLSWLTMFILFQGELSYTGSSWALFPRTDTDLSVKLLSFWSKNMIPYAVIPLLIGAAPRFRDFWKRSFMIYPLVCVLLIGQEFFSPELWQTYQKQIIYELSSPSSVNRERAHRQMEVMIHRFPKHEIHADLTQELADFYYQQGKKEKARDLYHQLISSPSRPQLFSARTHAEAALSKPKYLYTSSPIDMPLISYNKYMTNNWMVLLKAARLHRKDVSTEAELLSSLKDLSTKKESIALSPMPTLAELDDNARNLGLASFILHTDFEVTQKLLAHGYPVIVPVKNTFLLVYGLDSERNFAICSDYRYLLYNLKRNTGEDIDKDLLLENGSDADRHEERKRIEHISKFYLPGTYWDSPSQKDLSPFMSVLFVPGEENTIAEILGQPPHEIKRTSRAHLTALIALNSLKSGDPIQAIHWARKSSRLQPSSLSLQIARTAHLFWQTRDRQPLAKFPLSQNLPALKTLETQMQDEASSTFMEQAAQQFKQALEHQTLPWMIRMQYRDLLDRSIPEERAILLSLMRKNVESDPGDKPGWLYLASLYEWQGDMDHMMQALESAISAGHWDNSLALDLLTLYIRSNKITQAADLFGKIDKSKVQHNADYLYCRAALLAAEGKKQLADDLYNQAITKRKYTPFYHLDYARLLLTNNKDRQKAQTALEWAIRIDADGAVRREAQELLDSYFPESEQLNDQGAQGVQ